MEEKGDWVEAIEANKVRQHHLTCHLSNWGDFNNFFNCFISRNSFWIMALTSLSIC